MDRVAWALAIGLAIALGSIVGVLYADHSIADPALRYPVTLVTKLAGGLGAAFFFGRAAVLSVKRRVLARAPAAGTAFHTVTGSLALAAMSAIACAFGVALMVTQSRKIQLWPLPIVLIFGMLGAISTRNLWRVWQIYRAVRRK
jgi:predicted ABC-type sugar transport system permease subunit